ncbi:MAG: tetratricopeptide repeat protein, partial [Smithellaceae bacterium]
MQKKTILTLLVLALLGIIVGCADTSDFSKALKEAEAGNPDAQFTLGFMYHAGHGVARDDKKAVEWYTKAAEQGIAGAQYILGVMYQYGQSVPQDYKKAFEWYSKAAEQGNALAQLALGFMYHDGIG